MHATEYPTISVKSNGPHSDPKIRGHAGDGRSLLNHHNVARYVLCCVVLCCVVLCCVVLCCVVLCCVVCVCVSVCVCVCVDSPALIALYAKSGHSLKDADIEDDQEQNMGLEGKSFKSFQVMSCHCSVLLKFAYVANVDALRRSMPGKSGLHYDNLDNLHAVVRGRKRWFVTCGAWCCCRPYPSPSDCCCQFQENS
mgnify:CR=1 FL=1